MVPTHWVTLEAFPLTGSGKIDRKRLPAPEETKPDVDRNPTIPRTALERQLLAVWEQVLGTAYLRPDDNFFDLGGHSLLAIRLFAELEKLFGKRLPLATLFQAPTVTELARLLERDGWTPPWKSLVAVRTTGSNPAFFAVPGHGQSVLIFASLVNALGEDQPFYGLEAQGLDGTESPFDRIEDMARHFIEELRQVQPAGPYCLGGYCMGGLVAYEMAQQLRGRGEEVVFLALLDTWPPAARRLRIPMPRFLHPLRYLFQAGRRHARKVWGMEMSAWLPYARDRIGDVREILLQRDVYRGDRHVLQREIVNEANTRAMASYSPKPYPGRLHVMLDSQWGERAAARLSAYWKGLATGPFETGVVTSESGNMLSRASVPQLASGLRAGMAAALDGRGAAA
jgi:thioesterase domain-containing protein/acyl carrier protein